MPGDQKMTFQGELSYNFVFLVNYYPISAVHIDSPAAESV